MEVILCMLLRVCAVVLVVITTAQCEKYLRCYNRSMDKVLCNSGYQIRVESAHYADNGAITSCSDARIPSNLCISSVKTSYWQEIQEKCNGRTACRNLVAQKEATDCNGFFNLQSSTFFNPKTDYVLLEYSCDQVTTTTTTTTSTTTTTTTTNTIVTASPGDVKPAVQEENNNLALKIALPLILLLLAIVAVLIILFILRKRRRKAKAKAKAASDKNYEYNGTYPRVTISPSMAFDNRGRYIYRGKSGKWYTCRV